MTKKHQIKKIDHIATFSDFLDIKSPYFEKMMEILKDKSYTLERQKGYHLHHTIPRAISKYFGQDIQNDKQVLLTLGEHFLVHYYMDKCRLDGFGHYLAPSWRIIVANNKKIIIDFCSSSDLSAEIMSEVLDLHSYNLTKKDRKELIEKTYKPLSKETIEMRTFNKVSNNITKFLTENVPECFWDPILGICENISAPFSIVTIRIIWKLIQCIIENPALVPFIKKYSQDEDFYKKYEHKYRSNYVKKGYTNEIREKHSISNRKRKGTYKLSEEARKNISKRQTKIWEDTSLREAVSKRSKGNKWWNNGLKNAFCKECPGDGWINGRLPFKKTK